MTVTTVVIGEDDLLVREGILRILEPDDEVEVLAACADRDALLAAVARFTPDAVVTDIRMPPGFRDEDLRGRPAACDASIPARGSSCSARTPSRPTP